LREAEKEAIGAKNVLCVVFLGESSSADRHVTFNFTAQICLNGTVSSAVETSKQSIAKSVKSRSMGARNNEIIDVCREQNLVAV
jgi:hypothetical protein